MIVGSFLKWSVLVGWPCGATCLRAVEACRRGWHSVEAATVKTATSEAVATIERTAKLAVATIERAIERVEVAKLCKLLAELHLDDVGGTVTVLGNDELGEVFGRRTVLHLGESVVLGTVSCSIAPDSRRLES